MESDTTPPPSHSAPFHWRRHIIAWAIAAFAVLLALGARKAPGMVDSVWGVTFGPLLAWCLSWLSGWMPWALAEFLLVLFVLRQLFVGARGLRRWRNRARSTPALAMGMLLHLLHEASWLLATFILLWGLHYARPPLAERAAWKDLPTGNEIQALESDLAKAAIFQANALRDSLVFPMEEGRLQRASEAGWQALAAQDSSLSPVLGWRFPRVKHLFLSPVFDRLGISGVYVPWTAEATMNAGPPDAGRLHTLAHEKAHQRGIAREDEANFLGLRAGLSSPDPAARYAACLFASRQLLSRLAETNPVEARRLAGLRHPASQRDLEEIREHWRRHAGLGHQLARRGNDRYLRSQGIEEGTRSYGGSVDLLLAFAQMHGSPFESVDESADPLPLVFPDDGLPWY